MTRSTLRVVLPGTKANLIGKDEYIGEQREWDEVNRIGKNFELLFKSPCKWSKVAAVKQIDV